MSASMSPALNACSNMPWICSGSVAGMDPPFWDVRARLISVVSRAGVEGRGQTVMVGAGHDYDRLRTALERRAEG